MTAATLIPAVIDYLVTTCQASASLGAAATPVTVVDGESVTGDLSAHERLLWIGYDLLNPKAEVAAVTDGWPVIDHARTVNEQAEITCTAQFWSGDTTMKVNRDGCAAIVEAVANLLKGAPGGSGPGDTTMGGLVLWSRLSAASWSQEQRTASGTVVCVFRISYMARISV